MAKREETSGTKTTFDWAILVTDFNKIIDDSLSTVLSSEAWIIFKAFANSSPSYSKATKEFANLLRVLESAFTETYIDANFSKIEFENCTQDLENLDAAQRAASNSSSDFESKQTNTLWRMISALASGITWLIEPSILKVIARASSSVLYVT